MEGEGSMGIIMKEVRVEVMIISVDHDLFLVSPQTSQTEFNPGLGAGEAINDYPPPTFPPNRRDHPRCSEP